MWKKAQTDPARFYPRFQLYVCLLVMRANAVLSERYVEGYVMKKYFADESRQLDRANI